MGNTKKNTKSLRDMRMQKSMHSSPSSGDDLQLTMVGADEKTEYYQVLPNVSTYVNSIASEYGVDSCHLYRDPATDYSVVPVRCGNSIYRAVSWGDDNMEPSRIRRDISKNMIAQRCEEFNVTACYGQGLRFVDRATMKDTKNEDIRKFCLSSAIHEQFMQHCINMKYFYWSVQIINLSRDGESIVSLQTLDVTYCRVTERGAHKENYIIYGDWARTGGTDFMAIPRLNDIDPLGDLKVRMQKAEDPKTGLLRKSKDYHRQYAIVTRMPTPGFVYYPEIGYISIFRDAWNDIYRLIGIGKRQMIKNTSAPRIQIEVAKEYWGMHCNEKNILDPKARAAEIARHKQELKDFVCGIENVGKAIVTGYFVDPNGKEVRMVRINNLTEGARKEGGDWSEDMQEAANVICFAFGVHPNLVGATPGKSQMNNSGSDKRELFTLKQAMEKPWHDIMAKPYHLVTHYMGWKDITVDVPMIMLTTLDENKDAKKKTINNNNNDGNGDNSK